MKDKDIAKFWVYNNNTGSLCRKTLRYRSNDIETWYEDPKGYPTYDPFYVDENKDDLTTRVYLNLTSDLQETLSSAERLMGLIRKLTQKYN